MKTLVENNLHAWPELSGVAATNMPCIGKPPVDPWPTGVWCWDADADQVLVGTCPDDACILTYQEYRDE